MGVAQWLSSIKLEQQQKSAKQVMAKRVLGKCQHIFTLLQKSSKERGNLLKITT